MHVGRSYMNLKLNVVNNTSVSSSGLDLESQISADQAVEDVLLVCTV